MTDYDIRWPDRFRQGLCVPADLVQSDYIELHFIGRQWACLVPEDGLGDVVDTADFYEAYLKEQGYIALDLKGIL